MEPMLTDAGKLYTALEIVRRDYLAHWTAERFDAALTELCGRVLTGRVFDDDDQEALRALMEQAAAAG